MMEHNPEVARLEAEVERLRALWQTANEGLLESEAENTELGHEVERLRGELEHQHYGDHPQHVSKESQDALYADRDRARAEVERLADMAAFYAKGMDKQHAEVERLRAENNELHVLIKEHWSPEVERLRAQVGRIESLIQAAAGVVHVDDIRNALAKEQ